jgi:hypothetical protein
MTKPALCALLLAALTLSGCVSTSPTPTPDLVITTASLPSAPVGTAYSQQIQVKGGTAPYTYSATGLPTALSISSASGVIAGTPAQSAIGSATVAVTVTDASTPQKTAMASYTLAVTSSTLVITTTALPNAIVDTAYTAVIGASGGVTPYTYAASGLPSGLSINTTTGAITGQAALSAVGTANVQFTVTDAETAPQSAATNIVIKVVPAGLAIATTTLPHGVVNYPYSAAIVVSGGTPPYVFSATGLPSSLTLNTTTGAMTGTPVAGDAGTTQVTFSVTDSGSPTSQRGATQLPLTIDATAAAACKNISLGDEASLNGFVPFPADNAWNTDISAASVDSNSAAITGAAEFTGHFLHPDFSSVTGGNYGIPYTVVDSGTTPLAAISITGYVSQSDEAHAPFTSTTPIEGATTDTCTNSGDAHALVLDRATCTLYETFDTHYCATDPAPWSAQQETVWNLLTDEQRPWSWTSADAAGLAILPGLVRYDEVASGAIHHAIRFTMPNTLSGPGTGYYLPPATHAAGNSSTTKNVMGMRIRLKAGFDISGFSQDNQVILTAMKTYGLILADNGSAFYFQGAPDARWNDDDLNALKAVSSDNFEVVEMTAPAYPGYNDTTAPTGAAPVINSFTANATTVTAGTPVTLTWDVTGSSYDYIDLLGGVQGTSTVVTPTVTTTYTLYSTNQYGRSQQSITITVN